MLKLDGYALVTGGSRGCGAAICIQLAKDGYDVAVHYVSPSSKAKAEEVAEEVRKLGRKACVVQGNQGVLEDCNRLVTGTVAQMGEKMAILVNNAGITCGNTFESTPYEKMEELVRVNYMGPMWIARAALPYLKQLKNSTIIMVSSLSAETTMGNAWYAGSKAAVIQSIKQVGYNLGYSYGIRVNCCTPGTIRTDMINPEGNQEGIERISKESPLGTIGEPEDIAECVSYLVGASFVTCENITVSGGVFSNNGRRGEVPIGNNK